MMPSNFTFPDQELFEPVEAEDTPPSWGDRVRKWLTWLGAGAAVAGLLYLSGVYQALLLRPTPELFQREPLAQIISGDELMLSVRAVVLGAETPSPEPARPRQNDSVGLAAGGRWSGEAVERLVENASAILHQAGIELRIADIERRTVSLEMIRGFVRNPVLVAGVASQPKGVVTVALIETLQGLNGIAFVGSDIVAVADYTGSFNDRVLAHEVGHILGLGHVGDQSKLMAQGSEGVVLSVEEAEAIRRAAEVFLSAIPTGS
jgi:hypothetical protein